MEARDIDLHINPSDETIRLGPLAVKSVSASSCAVALTYGLREAEATFW